LYAGVDPGFQVRGAHLKKLRRAEGGAKMFGVFRVKNHDFTPKKILFCLYALYQILHISRNVLNSYEYRGCIWHV